MLREMKLSPEEAERFLYTKCGLLGVSGISHDMRKLRSLAATDPHARQAIDLFIYRIGREMGSLVAALGGIDALVFTICNVSKPNDTCEISHPSLDQFCRQVFSPAFCDVQRIGFAARHGAQRL